MEENLLYIGLGFCVATSVYLGLLALLISRGTIVLGGGYERETDPGSCDGACNVCSDSHPDVASSMVLHDK